MDRASSINKYFLTSDIMPVVICRSRVKRVTTSEECPSDGAWQGGPNMNVRNKCSAEKKSFAQQLRHNQTASEKLLGARLWNKAVGTRFRTQSVLFGYIVDFYAPEYKLVIEVDGSVHRNQQDYDRRRDKALFARGFRTLRFTNEQVANDIESVLAIIRWAMRKYGKQPKPKSDYELYMAGEKALSKRMY